MVPRSRVEHCTTDSLPSLLDVLTDFYTVRDTRHEHVFLCYDSYLVTTVILCMLVNCRHLTFFKIRFSPLPQSGTLSVSNSLDPDQD